MSIEELVIIHAKTKVGHLNRQIHTQRGFIKHLEEEKEVLAVENKRLRHRITGYKGAISVFRTKLAAGVGIVMATVLPGDFLPL